MLGIMVIADLIISRNQEWQQREPMSVCSQCQGTSLPTCILSCAHPSAVGDGLSMHGGQHKISDMQKPSLCLVAFKHWNL